MEENENQEFQQLVTPQILREKYALSENINRIQQIISDESGPNSVKLLGVCGSLLSTIISSTKNDSNKRHQIVIVADREEAAYLLNDLEAFLPNQKVYFFPSVNKKPFTLGVENNGNALMRAEVLNAISHDLQKLLVVTYAEAIAEKVVNKAALKQHVVDIQVSSHLNTDFLFEVLISYEFERVDFVFEPGTFSVRGGIVDVFSFTNDLPYRIEFLGDEVESIRTFDPETQLSVDSVASFALLPNINKHLAFEARESLLEFIQPDTLVWIKEPSLIRDDIRKLINAVEVYSSKFNSDSNSSLGSLTQSFDNEIRFFELINARKHFIIDSSNTFQTQENIAFNSSPQPSINKNFNYLIELVKKNDADGYQNLLLTSNTKQAERLKSIFKDLRSDVQFTPVNMTLHEGFIDHDLKIAAFTDHQLFSRFHKYKLNDHKEKSQALTLKELKELRKGDFVVHIDHGVGRFDGLERLNINGKQQESVRIFYKDNDILYVGINSLHKIAKFSSGDGTAPKLNKLGSDAWDRLKRKTKSKIKDIATELILLYAKRKATDGYSFTPDSYLQMELEASFMYEDTPDQLKAANAAKADMEKPYPMDRLVCGDVGFGKTEVAIRAAFKAVCDSKQVAVLVPTTILAYQHFKSFSERLKDFPCNIEYINRFKSAGEQKKVLAKLAEGKVDIIIGTHGLASKNVVFKDLGLLIIDEEQKFGVSIKEKLRELRVNVDTLTLTATPIPRTLQFSLMGSRDLSIINTPPPNRQPIETELVVMDEDKIRDAIQFEVSRGGQVFFVHNRVKNIQEMADMISKLCPGVSVKVAHGQMQGSELEDVMLSFIQGDFDVMVSTNIIESGLDIANANTIIINQAQNFGLSDLHQMRGRVGRSNRKAFCYLVTPEISTLTTDALKRLQTIEQFNELGSGFQVAMRDLDIRGAGNLLGSEQSGFMSDIGFEMFHKILDEAVRELKENEFAGVYEEELNKSWASDCLVDTDIEALIPDKYVTSTQERLALYMELDNLNSEDALANFGTQLEDRFGPLPTSVANLFNAVKLRWIAQKVGFEKVILKNNVLKATFISGDNERYFTGDIFGNILEYVKNNPNKSKLIQKNKTVQLEIQGVGNIDFSYQLFSEWMSV